MLYEKQEAALHRGAFDFLTKPIDFADLELTIDKTIRGRVKAASCSLWVAKKPSDATTIARCGGTAERQ